ncbi:MAG: SGNH/GDSL hydrolase family protein [Rhodopirellula sp.]|nr:SGNH/GDSL hydrolase family protein [Rhodopirellula sp.]
MQTIARMTVLLFALVWLPSQAIPAESPAAPPVAAQPEFKTLLPEMDLKDGDAVVFLGDSITHQCLYTQYVEDYFYTRFPKLRIRFHNAGVGGDRAADALARFDDDVAAFKPKYVTILLGMNDGSYRDFDKAIFDTYQAGMTTLLDRIAAAGATAIPMTPTMFDSRANKLRGKGAEPRDTYYNGVLALYGAWLREVAQTRGLGFVDMYSPLNALTFTERKKDATFTLIPDAVHPAASGQVVMAAAVVNDICPRTSVSAITIQEKGGKLAAVAANGKVTDFQADNDAVRFTFTANALPWVLPPDALPGYQLVRAGHKYSMEGFSARNLKPGKYELKIDGQSVGMWADTQLAFRLELETNDKTPQYQQALSVAMLNKERNDKVIHPLRDLWLKRKVRLAQLGRQVAEKDPQADAKKEQFAKWIADEFQPAEAKLQAEARKYEDQIYQANQPAARKYELIRVK